MRIHGVCTEALRLGGGSSPTPKPCSGNVTLPTTSVENIRFRCRTTAWRP